MGVLSIFAKMYFLSLLSNGRTICSHLYCSYASVWLRSSSLNARPAKNCFGTPLKMTELHQQFLIYLTQRFEYVHKNLSQFTGDDIENEPFV